MRPALVSTLVCCFSFAGPCLAQQAASSSQLATCADNQLNASTCNSLATEFQRGTLKQALSDGTLATDTSVPSLDNVMSDTGALAAALTPRARRLVLGADLKTVLQPELMAALQIVAMNAALVQAGSPATSSGSTNLAMKPTTTDLISIAAESGAFTDTTNGSSFTIQANALGLAKLLSNTPVFQRIDTATADAVQPLNFSIVLTTAQASAASAVTTGKATTTTPTLGTVFVPSNNAAFTSFSASYDFFRKYNPQSKSFQAAWMASFRAHSAALAAIGSSIAADINRFTPPDQQQALLDKLQDRGTVWHNAGAVAETQDNFDSFVTAYLPYWNAALALLLPDQTAAGNLLALDKDIAAFNQATYVTLNEARGKLATISYTFNAADQKPATHNITASASFVFKGTPDLTTGKASPSSGLQITGNFTASIYQSLPATATYGRLRDLQVAAEVDKPLGGTIASPRVTLSAAGYGQYQFDPTVLNITAGNLAPGTNIVLPSDAQVLLGTSGWLGVVQGKLILNLAHGLSVPVAVKWSNKTDLLQANDVRGQFGLSYDLSALRSLVTGQR